MIDLLDDGWPEGLALPDPPPPAQLGGLRFEGIARLGAFYAASELRGFRTVVVALPPDRPVSEQFRIRMRLRDWSWRLIEIDLTDTLRARIVERVSQTWKRAQPAAGPRGAVETELRR